MEPLFTPESFYSRPPSRLRRVLPFLLVAAVLVLAAVLWPRGAKEEPAAPADPATNAPPAVAEAPAAPEPAPGPAVEGTLTEEEFAGVLSAARELDAQGRLPEARERLLDALSKAGSAYAPALEKSLGSLSTRIYFSNAPGPDKAEVTVDAPLATIAARHNCPVALIQRMNGIANPNSVQAGRRLVVLDRPKFEVLVSKSRNTLLLTLNGRFFKRYVVATGEGGNTPVGTFRMVERFENPEWETGGRKIPYDGTGENGNILGTRYLKLDVPGYGIHGTWDESTLGRQSSAGCVRMRNADVEELYVLLPRGTPVTIED